MEPFTVVDGKFKFTYYLLKLSGNNSCQFVKDNVDGKRKMVKAKTTDNKYLPLDFIETLKGFI